MKKMGKAAEHPTYLPHHLFRCLSFSSFSLPLSASWLFSLPRFFSCLCFSRFCFSSPLLPPLLLSRRLSRSTEAVTTANFCAARLSGLHHGSSFRRSFRSVGAVRPLRPRLPDRWRKTNISAAWRDKSIDRSHRGQKGHGDQKERDRLLPPAGPFHCCTRDLPPQDLPLGNNWRRGFALADILRAASDAKEGQHRRRR